MTFLSSSWWQKVQNSSSGPPSSACREWKVILLLLTQPILWRKVQGTKKQRIQSVKSEKRGTRMWWTSKPIWYQRSGKRIGEKSWSSWNAANHKNSMAGDGEHPSPSKFFPYLICSPPHHLHLVSVQTLELPSSSSWLKSKEEDSFFTFSRFWSELKGEFFPIWFIHFLPPAFLLRIGWRFGREHARDWMKISFIIIYWMDERERERKRIMMIWKDIQIQILKLHLFLPH